VARKFASATVGLGRPSFGGRRASRCLQRDCVLPSSRAVHPSAASETSVPHGKECIESVRSNQRTLFAGR
jgi:hypothetical protein